MKGLEISERYWKECGLPAFREKLPELLPLMAVGLTGAGSECFGYDDEVSPDHDFEPGFCVFIPDESLVDERQSFRAERVYAGLPKSFEGFTRASVSPVGGQRHGIHRISEYFIEKVGSPDGNLSLRQWLTLSQPSLAEAVNGVIFEDSFGTVTAIRERLADMPEDIRRKRLAGHLLMMAQTGQYNYLRCLKHGETGAAQLAVTEFCSNMMDAVFLLNRRYAPFYKWKFRAMRELPRLSELAETAEYLITTGNDGEFSETKYFLIEETASAVIGELQAQNMTQAICGNLEKHAYSVNDSVSDSEIRNLNILCAI